MPSWCGAGEQAGFVVCCVNYQLNYNHSQSLCPLNHFLSSKSSFPHLSSFSFWTQKIRSFLFSNYVLSGPLNGFLLQMSLKWRLDSRPASWASGCSTCMCMCEARITSDVILRNKVHLFWHRTSYWSGGHQLGYTGWPVSPWLSCLCLPALGLLTNTPPHPEFLFACLHQSWVLVQFTG